MAVLVRDEIDAVWAASVDSAADTRVDTAANEAAVVTVFALTRVDSDCWFVATVPDKLARLLSMLEMEFVCDTMVDSAVETRVDTAAKVVEALAALVLTRVERVCWLLFAALTTPDRLASELTAVEIALVLDTMLISAEEVLVDTTANEAAAVREFA